MSNEAKARARLANLSEEETVCLRMRLEGVSGRHIAHAIGAKSTVTRRVQSAIEKLKAVPAEMISAPEEASYLFDLGKEANLYSVPTPTGSALARERMKLSDAAFQKLVIN